MSPLINVKEFIKRLHDGEALNLLDVREAVEYHTYNIGGRNVPLSTFSEGIDKIGYNKTDEIIVICTAGLRSNTAREILEQNGYQHARNLWGGLLAIQKLKQ
jgi:adenylyltransferase/sulfurtransferase